MTVTSLIEQLKRDEGSVRDVNGRHIPYRDPLGFLTIGYGRCLERNPLTEEEAVYLLTNDARAAESAVAMNIVGIDHVDAIRREAMVNMAYNLGIGGVLQFRRFLGAVRSADWQRAAAEMLASKWATQVNDRAKRLATQIITGERQ